MFFKIQSQIYSIFKNIKNNITYYLIFQVLLNLFFIYSSKYSINKETGENLLPFYFGLIISGIYILPFVFFTLIIKFFITSLGFMFEGILYNFTVVVGTFLSTIIVTSLPPFSNWIKDRVKVKNKILEYTINIILTIVILFTFSIK